jgi:hypothetical protein
MSRTRQSLLAHIIDAIDQGEIPLALAIELAEPQRLERAWDRMQSPHILFELLVRTRPQRIKLRQWARSAAYFAGLNSQIVESVLRDGQPVPDDVKDLRPSSAWFWAWEVIKAAVQNENVGIGQRALYCIGQARVPDDFILESMLRPEGPPTLGEIVAAAERQRERDQGAR